MGYSATFFLTKQIIKTVFIICREELNILYVHTVHLHIMWLFHELLICSLIVGHTWNIYSHNSTITGHKYTTKIKNHVHLLIANTYFQLSSFCSWTTLTFIDTSLHYSLHPVPLVKPKAQSSTAKYQLHRSQLIITSCLYIVEYSCHNKATFWNKGTHGLTKKILNHHKLKRELMYKLSGIPEAHSVNELRKAKAFFY